MLGLSTVCSLFFIMEQCMDVGYVGDNGSPCDQVVCVLC